MPSLSIDAKWSAVRMTRLPAGLGPADPAHPKCALLLRQHRGLGVAKTSHSMLVSCAADPACVLPGSLLTVGQSR